MKILALPREDTNLYQAQLYGEMRRQGARVSYLGAVTPSQTVNFLLLPLELAVRRLAGARVVHLHWVYAFSLPGSTRFRFLARASEAWFCVWLWSLRSLGLRLVWTAHNVLPGTPVFADDLRARRRLVASCDLVVAHSQSTLTELSALGIVPRRSEIIPHGPFTAAVRPGSLRTPGAGKGPRQLLFFGKIRPYKGVDILLEAFATLPPELDAHLTVAGECNDRSLTVKYAELAGRSSGRVTLLLERVPEHDVSHLLEQADVMVLPYRHITTSGSAVLALCHGRPLVVPDLPGLAELPDDGIVRYDGTAQGLRTALASIISADASVLAKMSSAANDYCAAMSWSEIAKKTLATMSEMLGDDEVKS